jgi:hypothetical protein
MWSIVTKKIGRVAVKEQGKSEHLLLNRSFISIIQDSIQLLTKNGVNARSVVLL